MLLGMFLAKDDCILYYLPPFHHFLSQLFVLLELFFAPRLPLNVLLLFTFLLYIQVLITGFVTAVCSNMGNGSLVSGIQPCFQTDLALSRTLDSS